MRIRGMKRPAVPRLWSTFEKFIVNVALLLIFFNLSLTYGEIPQRWRHFSSVLYFKKESAIHPENYRPVSITSVFCRGEGYKNAHSDLYY